MTLDIETSQTETRAMPKSLIRVALVEDDPVVRNSLSQLIGESPGFRCVAACSSGEEAVQSLPHRLPAGHFDGYQSVGDDAADALRYLVATKARSVVTRKLRGG